MNTENILKVADAIEAGDLVRRGIGFNMAAFCSQDERDQIDGCGTTACLAGWAYALRYPSVTGANLQRVFDRDAKTGNQTIRRIPAHAAEYLGLDKEQADLLFRSGGNLDYWYTNSKITPRQAVRVLRYLAKTGKVSWSFKVMGKP